MCPVCEGVVYQPLPIPCERRAVSDKPIAQVKHVENNGVGYSKNRRIRLVGELLIIFLIRETKQWSTLY